MISAIVFLILGLVLLVFSADFLVKGASRLATAVGVSPLVVGLTVVAFGTSAPELSVSVMSAYKGQADIAVGNVVGSNIFNVLAILGISALIVPLVVHRQLIKLDVPVMIGVSVGMLVLSLDGKISRLDGIILFAGAVWYTVFLIRQSRKESALEEPSGEPAEPAGWAKNLGFIVVGIGGLVLGSQWLVDGSVLIARHFGVSELIIGLTIVSVGTSLPEVATSVVAAWKGERDIAVGNVVGSNIFNIVSVLGLASIVAPDGIAVSPAALYFDIPVMIAVAVACLPVFFANYRISKVNGVMFLAFYGAYLTYLFMSSSHHDGLDEYRTALFNVVAPITGITLTVIAWRAWKLGHPHALTD
jgi:cation:H+ antiporter